MSTEDKIYRAQNLALVGVILLLSPWIMKAGEYFKPDVEVQECRVYHVNAPRPDLRCERKEIDHG
jgi:hypothetical protein